MKIVLNVDGVEQVHRFDSNNVLLGRSDSCHITIKSHHISRKHLEITERDGSIFAKDLTIGNWVSYNGDKMEKNLEIQVFDFCDILLPGNVTLKVFNKEDNEDKNELTESEVRKLKLRNISIEKAQKKSPNLEPNKDIYQDLVKKGHHTLTRDNLDLDDKKGQGESSSKFMIIVLFIIFSAILTSLLFVMEKKGEDVNIPSTPNPLVIEENKKTKKNVVKQKTEKKVVKSLQMTIADDLKTFYRLKGKCQGAMANYCSTIFSKRNIGEGVEVKRKVFTVYKNFDVRLNQLFSGKNTDYINAQKIFYSEYIVAGHNILDPKVLESIEKDGLFKIRIVLYLKVNQQLKVKSTFLVDSSFYRRFDSSDYLKSIELFVNEQDYSKFKRVFNNYMTKEF